MNRPTEGSLVFSEHPVFEIATNRFVEVPIILQYEDTPILEVTKTARAGYMVQIPIYHSDGTCLARVKGPRLFLTAEGEKADLVLSHPQNATVCKLGARTLFEIRRTEAAALETAAELYTPDGAFLKCNNQSLAGYVLASSGTHLAIGKLIMTHCTITRAGIGIHVKKDGSVIVAGPLT